MKRRSLSRAAAALALAAALHLTASPLSAAGPPGRRAPSLRQESWIEAAWSRVVDAWNGLAATWADDGVVIDPFG